MEVCCELLSTAVWLTTEVCCVFFCVRGEILAAVLPIDVKFCMVVELCSGRVFSRFDIFRGLQIWGHERGQVNHFRHIRHLFLPRNAMHKRGLCCHAVSVRLSVTFVDHVKTNKHIFEIFSPSGSDTILVFPYQRGCRYSDGKRRRRIQGSMIKCRFFHKYLAVSQKRLYLNGHMQRENL